jgi:uncharacterized protein (TIGR00251 family)
VSARITVRVTPRSGRESIEAGAGGVLSVRVTAAPDDGKANAAVCKVVAAALGVPKTSVSVVRGHTARVKTLEVAELTDADVQRLLPR